MSWISLHALLAVLLAVVLCGPASAATFVVDATEDAGDANPGDGVCDSILVGVDCTLRAAVQEANALAGRDAITIEALTVVLNIAGAEESAVAGDLDVHDDLDVEGSGFTTLQATHGEPIFDLRAGSLELSLLTLADGGVTTEPGTALRMSAVDLNRGVVNRGRAALEEITISGSPELPIDNFGTLSIFDAEISFNLVPQGSPYVAAIRNAGHLLGTRLYVHSNDLFNTGDALLNTGRISLSNARFIEDLASEIRNTGEVFLSNVSSGTIVNGGTVSAKGSYIWDCGNFSIGNFTSLGYNTYRISSCPTTPGPGDVFNSTDPANRVPAALCPLVELFGARRDVADGFCDGGAIEATSTTLRACSDGVDDDGDGLIDLQDPGCRDASDPSEAHLRPGDYVLANSDTGGTSVFDPETTRIAPVMRASGAILPWDVLVDGDGEILISDALFDALTRVDPERLAETLVSAGGSISAPTGLAQDPSGDVFVAQNLTDVILAIDPVTGLQTTILNDPLLSDVDDLLRDPADGSLLVSDPTNGLFRINDPLGTPSVSPFSTSVIQQSRQLVFDGTGDVIVADDGLNAPIRFDPVTSAESTLLTGTPFTSLQGAGVEPSGLFLFADNATGLITRVDEAGDTSTPLNFGRADVGLRHMAAVPTPASLTLTLSDTLVIDGGTAGVADAGDTLELTAVVTNTGASAADLLSLESGLDPNLTLVAGQTTTTQGSIIEGNLASDPRLEVDLGSLAPAASATVTWQVDIADPSPARAVTANAWVRRDKIILAESDDPTTGPANDPNVIGIGDYGVVVQATQKISDTRGGLSGPGNPGSVLLDGGVLGDSLEPLGDIDGDGVEDVAVGSSTDSEAGTNFGAFHILLLNADGSVKQRHKWSAASPDLAAALSTAGLSLSDDRFGAGISYLGDLDGADPADFALAVSAWYDSGMGGDDRGAVYILFMDASPLQVLSATKIGDGVGGFPPGQLGDFDYFGKDIENIGDVDGDGVIDLAVGAHLDDTIGLNSGGVWILFLTTSGTVKPSPPSQPVQILVTPAAAGDYFGLGIASLGLFDGDSVPDIAVGATRRDTGGLESSGGIWILTLNSNGTIKTPTEIAPGVGGFPMGLLEADDRFGRGLEVLPDLDGDGVVELLVGANRDADAGFRTGAAYAVFLTPAGGTDQVVQLAPQPGVLFNELDDNDRFGVTLAPLGDLDGDGNPEIAAGAIFDDDGGDNRGAVYVLHTATPVPEPGAFLSLATGVALLAVLNRRRTTLGDGNVSL